MSMLVLLHPNSAALGTLPFSLLVVNVALEFFHGDFAGLAGHWYFQDCMLTRDRVIRRFAGQTRACHTLTNFVIRATFKRPALEEQL
jgi:hypothetical protein